MKQLLILGLLIFFSISYALGQTAFISFNSGKTAVHYYEGKAHAEMFLRFKNISGKDINLSWETIAFDVPDGWSYNTCDNGNCFEYVPPIAEEKWMNPIETDGFGFLKMEVINRECAAKPTATFKFIIYPRGQKELAEEVVFIFRCYPTGRMDEKSPFSVYPNPVTDQIIVQSSDRLLKSVSIVNMLGETVFTRQGDNNAMDVSTLPAGIFFLIAEDVNGLTYTEKIIKQ